jgi:5-methylcytosine-specific restriction endonuclease McrBC regulatory subunit McrC
MGILVWGGNYKFYSHLIIILFFIAFILFELQSCPKSKFDEADFYQMYAYAQRYNCPNVLMIYPQVEGMSEFCEAFKIDGGDRAITAATIDLCGDLSKEDERVKLVARLKALFNNLLNS